MITRAEWGARDPHNGCLSNRNMADVDTAVVHYSDVVPPDDPAGAHDEATDGAAGQVRSIQAFHMDSRGWCDIAYHRLIAPDGAVYEGRPLGAVGAHAAGHNHNTVGYCFLTNDTITDEAKSAFVAQLAADQAAAARTPWKVITHRSVCPTHCPGDTIAEWVGSGLSAPAESSPTTPPAPAPCNQLPPGPAPAGTATLKVGDRGPAVSHLQSLLWQAGYLPNGSRRADGSFDGIFGTGTQVGVHALQAAHGLVADGVAGRQTWCVLGVRD